MILIKNIEKHLKEKYNAEFLYLDATSSLKTELDDWVFYITTYIVYYKDGLKYVMHFRDVRDEQDLLNKIDEMLKND